MLCCLLDCSHDSAVCDGFAEKNPHCTTNTRASSFRLDVPKTRENTCDKSVAETEEGFPVKITAEAPAIEMKSNARLSHDRAIVTVRIWSGRLNLHSRDLSALIAVRRTGCD